MRAQEGRKGTQEISLLNLPFPVNLDVFKIEHVFERRRSSTSVQCDTDRSTGCCHAPSCKSHWSPS